MKEEIKKAEERGGGTEEQSGGRGEIEGEQMAKMGRNSEEREQKVILRRLYGKYGSNAR